MRALPSNGTIDARRRLLTNTPWRGEPRCFSPPAPTHPRPAQTGCSLPSRPPRTSVPRSYAATGGKRAGPKCDGLHGAQRPDKPRGSRTATR